MKLAQKLALNYLRASLNITAVFSKRRAAEKAFDIFCTPFRKSKKPEPAIFKKAERLYISVDGYRVAVYRWNHGGSGRAMVLHGFESAARNFDRYIAPLIRKGYEVIAFDAPAHGASEGSRINLPLYVKAIGQVVGLTGMPDRFMSHSFGGIAVMHFLEKIPSDPAVRVALIAPATETVSAIDSLFRILQLDESVRAEFEKIIEEKGGDPSSYYSIPRTLETVKAKILWVHDEEDDITPFSDLKPLVKAAPENIEFMITRGWGHRKIYRENKVVKKVTEFL